MAALPPPNPPAVALPAQPNDPNVPMPAAPNFPPTVDNIIAAMRYREDVHMSFAHQPDEACTLDDLSNSGIYEHSILAQAAAVAGPQAAAPPWFQGAVQQLRNDIQNDIQQLRNDVQQLRNDVMNQGRGDGNIVRFEIIPFANGNDPTLQPHNLPPLYSVDTIQQLDGATLSAYLTGYGIDPLPAAGNPDATNRLRKETLKRLVGGFEEL
ncbi:hypothetical protein JOM56_005548 [Amanita muscaria]